MNARERAEDVERRYVSGDKTTLVWLVEGAIIAAEEAKAREEREACAEIANEHERQAMVRLEESKRNGKGLSELGHAFEASAAKFIGDKIRARSEGEKKGE